MIHSTLYTILFQVKENNMKKSDSQSYVIFNQSSLVRKHLFNKFYYTSTYFLDGMPSHYTDGKLYADWATMK